MLHMNRKNLTGWRVWNQLTRIANSSNERMVNYTNGVLAGSASERLMPQDEFERLVKLANAIADARREELRHA